MNNNIDKFLNKLNWKFKRINDTTIVSGFRGKEDSFTLFISEAEEWVIFLTYANLLPIPDEKRAEILSILTKLNYDTPFIKFSIDENSNIVVSVEFPCNLINEASIEISLDSLCSSGEFIYALLPDYHEFIETHVS